MKSIWISEDKIEELKSEARLIDIPLNSLIKLKLFGNKQMEAQEVENSEGAVAE